MLDPAPTAPVSTSGSDLAGMAGMAVEITAAYVAHNSVPAVELPGLLTAVHGALADLGRIVEPEVPAKPVPAVPVRKSVADDYLVSLEDGRRYKTLKRHLGRLGLTPEEYRTKWGLPADYPMVAPAYGRARSALAKSIGLGQQRRKR